MASPRANPHAPVAMTATILVGAFLALLGLVGVFQTSQTLQDGRADTGPLVLDLIASIVTVGAGVLVMLSGRTFAYSPNFVPAAIGWAALLVVTGIFAFVRPMVAGESELGRQIVTGLMMAGSGGVALAAVASWNGGARRNAGILGLASGGLYLIATMVAGRGVQETAIFSSQTNVLVSLALLCAGLAAFMAGSSNTRSARGAAALALMGGGFLAGVALIVVGATAFDFVDPVGTAFDDDVLAGFQALFAFFALLSALVGGLAAVGASAWAAFARLPADTRTTS